MNPEIQPVDCPICDQPPEIEERIHAAGPCWICTHRCIEKPNWYVELSDDFNTRAQAVENWNWLVEALARRKG